MSTLDLLRAVGKPNPVIDLAAARQFVSAITGSVDTPMTWVATHERQGIASHGSLFLFGPLRAHAAALMEANEQGCSITCIVNRTNGTGTTAGDVEAVRALWICTDSEDARFTREQVFAMRPRPDLIVETDAGEFDLFWTMQEDECSLNDFSKVIWHITRHFKSNPRVMHIEWRFRVPGFNSWRDESKPRQVEIILDRTRGER